MRGAVASLVVCVGLLGVCSSLAAQERADPFVFARDARADVLELQDLLERVHPDPYTGFGGRVAFQRAFRAVLDALPQDSIAVSDLRVRLASLLGGMSDGHTGLSGVGAAGSDVPQAYLPVRFDAASDGLFVSDAMPDHPDLVGALVQAVEGVPADEMAFRSRVLFPSENLSGARRRLALALASRTRARILGVAAEAELHLTVVPPGATGTREVTLPYELSTEEWRTGPWLSSGTDALSAAPGPFSGRMVAGGRVGYLRLRAMWSREAFENMRAAGRTDLGRWLQFAYRNLMPGAAPDDEGRAIAGFPSLIEETHALLTRMGDEGATDLIVDLRGNDGGFAIIGDPFLYQLFGSAYLAAPDPVYFATRVSDEYLALRDLSLDALSGARGRDVRMGDLLFEPPLSRPPAPMTARDFVDRQAEHGFSRADLLDEDVPRPRRVVVLADAATFSAAFDLTYQLHRMGAVLVGVAPSQSPRSFTDATPFALSRSGIEGSLSRSAVVYPGIPEEAGAVVMDLPMTWARLAESGFHPDAPLAAALEFLGYPRP